MEYIALLKGINVGGHHKIKMLDLVHILEIKGFEQIRFYIQSGNLVLISPLLNKDEAAKAISEAIFERYQFKIPTIIYEREEWKEIILKNPFIENAENLKNHYLTFLTAPPHTEEKASLEAEIKNNEDLIVLFERVLYLKLKIKYNETKWTNANIEKKLKCFATTRNWKTCLAILKLLK